MPTGDVWQVQVRGRVVTQDHVHTLHFRDITGLAAPTAIVTVWQASCRTAFRNLFESDDLPVQDYVITQVCGSLPFAASAAATEPGATQGGTRTSSSDLVPSWLARVISWRTAFSGRRYRGRSYLGGMHESWLSFNTLSAGDITLMDAYANTILTAFGPTGSSSDWRAVVYSQRARDLGATCIAAGSQITGFLSRTQVGSMKSRKLGHGN